MKELAELPVPSIAAVNGPAVAAGCQLVAACDLAISAKSAIFAASGIKLGLFCNTPGVPLVRAIGLRAANELLLTGRYILSLLSLLKLLKYKLSTIEAPRNVVDKNSNLLVLRILGIFF
ncbi:unnamed protein product [Trichobilharzia regenti]|nr:unnamed protein product [Trichobilharzia regenti]